jgi:drug/metabolite transporter (DMT)-like permease
MSATRLTPTQRGVLSMLCAVGFFAAMDTGLKLLSAHYPAAQVAALRGLASLPLVAAWALASVGARALLQVRWSLHLLRGVLAVLMMVAFTYALRSLPLTTAYALFFVAPLFITALSGPVLGERVGAGRWLAVAGGGIGVLVVLRPSADGLLGWGGLAVIGSAAAYALSAVTVRLIGKTDSTQTMVFWMVTMLSLGASALALPGWQPLHAGDGWVIAGVGVVGALGQYAITEAFRLGEASVIAPLEYTALVWGLGIDIALWHAYPDAITLVGAGIIVGSGLYLLRRERTHLEAEHP